MGLRFPSPCSSGPEGTYTVRVGCPGGLTAAVVLAWWLAYEGRRGSHGVVLLCLCVCACSSSEWYIPCCGDCGGGGRGRALTPRPLGLPPHPWQGPAVTSQGRLTFPSPGCTQRPLSHTFSMSRTLSCISRSAL